MEGSFLKVIFSVFFVCLILELVMKFFIDICMFCIFIRRVGVGVVGSLFVISSLFFSGRWRLDCG